jgi:hypothetical protein
MVVCAVPSFPEARGTPSTVADLAAHDCLGYTLSNQQGFDRRSFGKDGALVAPDDPHTHVSSV